MSQFLLPQQLTLNISAQQFKFADTSALIATERKSAQHQAWVAQSEAKKAAEFGLNIQQAGFNLLALGEPGTGRTTLMLSAMQEVAAQLASPTDLIALYQFDLNGKPLFVKLPAGVGTQLKQAQDNFIRQLAKALPTLLEAKIKENSLKPIQTFLETQLNVIVGKIALIQEHASLINYFKLLKQDVLEYLDAWQPSLGSEGEANIDALLSESFFGRYRVNVLVEHAVDALNSAINAPAIYDNDPSLQSLFGGIESAGEARQCARFYAFACRQPFACRRRHAVAPLA